MSNRLLTPDEMREGMIALADKVNKEAGNPYKDGQTMLKTWANQRVTLDASSSSQANPRMKDTPS